MQAINGKKAGQSKHSVAPAPQNTKPNILKGKFRHIGPLLATDYTAVFPSAILQSNLNILDRLSRMSYKTALVTQAIKARGKESLDKSNIQRIRRTLSVEERLALLEDAKYTTTRFMKGLRKYASKQNNLHYISDEKAAFSSGIFVHKCLDKTQITRLYPLD